MKILISPLAPENTTVVKLEWPESIRLPVVGEKIIVPGHMWRIAHVIFELPVHPTTKKSVDTATVLFRVVSE